MDIQVIQSPPIPVILKRHQGPYDQISSAFGPLFDWVNANSIPFQRTIGVYWDNPDFVSSSQLRSAACAEVPLGYTPPNLDGTGLEFVQLAGGNYAITRFVGPYDQLAPVWSQFTSQIEGPMGRAITDDPSFEVYLNDPSDTPADQLVTDLYMPIR